MSRRPRTLTIRNVPPELDEALKREKRRRGQSVNQIVLDLLAEDLGVGGKARSNGLARLGGVWSADELSEFEAATAAFEEVDEDLWA